MGHFHDKIIEFYNFYYIKIKLKSWLIYKNKKDIKFMLRYYFIYLF